MPPRNHPPLRASFAFGYKFNGVQYFGQTDYQDIQLDEPDGGFYFSQTHPPMMWLTYFEIDFYLRSPIDNGVNINITAEGFDGTFWNAYTNWYGPLPLWNYPTSPTAITGFTLIFPIVNIQINTAIQLFCKPYP